MTSLPSIDLDIVDRLRADPEFRQAYFLAESSGMIARDLIRLRKRRGLNQTEVAAQLDTRQPAISRVESADYRNWSFNTLRRLAEALDARLRVTIEPSEDVLGEYETPKAEEPKTSPPSPPGQVSAPKKETNSILSGETISAANDAYELKQRNPPASWDQELGKQTPHETISKTNSDLMGAACN